MVNTTTLADVAAGKKPTSPVASFSSFLDKLKPQLALALPRHMNADRMARLALTAFSTTPGLQECSPQSIAGCIMTAAQLGLEPGVGGQCYLIPYKDRRKGATICTLIPGWKGLVDLVARSGRATVWTGVVFEGDEFEYQLGDAPFCRHKPGDGEGQFTHVYAIGRVKDAQMPVIEVWSRAKVDKHLRRYNKVGERHYAVGDENNFEMYGRKVALLQVLKYMPASIELSNAITIAHASEEGRGAVIEGDFVTLQDPEPGDTPDPETGEVAPPAPAPEVATQTGKAGAAAGVVANNLQPAGPSYAQLVDKIKAAKSGEDADLILDAARHLPKDQYEELVRLRESTEFKA